MISSRVNNIKPSLTIATNMKAQELKRAGKDIIVIPAKVATVAEKKKTQAETLLSAK